MDLDKPTYTLLINLWHLIVELVKNNDYIELINPLFPLHYSKILTWEKYFIHKSKIKNKLITSLTFLMSPQKLSTYILYMTKTNYTITGKTDGFGDQ